MGARVHFCWWCGDDLRKDENHEDIFTTITGPDGEYIVHKSCYEATDRYLNEKKWTACPVSSRGWSGEEED